MPRLSRWKQEGYFHRYLKPFEQLSVLNYGLLLLIVLPIFYWILNSSWAYTRGFSIDPWVYYGHMLRPEYFLKHIPTYSASRMAYILPGFFFNKLFPPLVANFLMRMFLYYLTTISIYLTLKVTLSERAGLIAGVMMGSYLPFLSAIGWNHVDGGGIAYLAFTVAMLTLAAKADSQHYWSGAAGIAAGLMFHTHIALALFFPVLVLYFVSLSYFYHPPFVAWRKLVLRSFIPAASGFLIITAIIGAINYTFDQNFFFFKWSFEWANNNVIQTDDAYQFKDIDPDWYLQRGYLAPIIAILGGCLLYLYPNKLKTIFSEEHPKIILIFLYLCFVFTYLIIDVVAPFFFLQFYWYTSYIYVPMFIALGVLTYSVVATIDKQQFIAVVGMIVIFSALAFRVEAWRDILPKRDDNFVMLQILLIILPSIILLVMRPRLWSIGLVILSLSLIHYRIVDQQDDLLISEDYFGIDYLTDLMIVVNETNTMIDETIDDETIWFWYNYNEAEEPVGRTFISIAASHLYLYRLVSPEFPQLFDYLRFEPNTNVALLWDDDPTTWDKAVDTLSIYCQEPTILADEEIEHGKIHLNVTIFRTQWIPGREFQSGC